MSKPANNKQLAKREESGVALVQNTLSADRKLPAAVQEAVAHVLNHTLMVRAVVESVMKQDVHYGVIPGTDKPTLYQPGAQTLALTFKLRASFDERQVDLPNGHREYQTKTTITDHAGTFLGHGVGLCSTMESKYRYRGAEDFTDTGESVPSTYWNLKSPKEKKRALVTIMDDASGNYGTRKIQGQWHIVKFPEERALMENPNLADCFNTVLKISKKRSLVDGVLNVTGASDMFGQDLEDLDDNLSSLQAATGLDLDGTGRGITSKPKQASAATPDVGKPAQVSPINGDWRGVNIHVGQRVKGKRLGDVDLAAIKALKAGWLDKMDWENNPNTTHEDRKLRKAIVAALAEDELLGKSKARIGEQASAEPTRPVAGSQQPRPTSDTPERVKPQESPPAGGSERGEVMAEIEHILISHQIEEADLISELRKHEYLGNLSDQIKALKDLPPDWLPDLLAGLPQLLKDWGYVQ